MKTLLFGLTFLVMSTQIFADVTLSTIVIHNPVGLRPDGTTGPVPFTGGPITYSTGSNTQFDVTTQLGEPVQFVPTQQRTPAQAEPAPATNTGPVPYDNTDFWHRPRGDSIPNDF